MTAGNGNDDFDPSGPIKSKGREIKHPIYDNFLEDPSTLYFVNLEKYLKDEKVIFMSANPIGL
jgi:hypothetical protein